MHGLRWEESAQLYRCVTKTRPMTRPSHDSKLSQNETCPPHRTNTVLVALMQTRREDADANGIIPTKWILVKSPGDQPESDAAADADRIDDELPAHPDMPPDYPATSDGLRELRYVLPRGRTHADQACYRSPSGTDLPGFTKGPEPEDRTPERWRPTVSREFEHMMEEDQEDHLAWMPLRGDGVNTRTKNLVAISSFHYIVFHSEAKNLSWKAEGKKEEEHEFNAELGRRMEAWWRDQKQVFKDGGMRRSKSPSCRNLASWYLQLALLTPQVNPGSRYRCGKRT